MENQANRERHYASNHRHQWPPTPSSNKEDRPARASFEKPEQIAAAGTTTRQFGLFDEIRILGLKCIRSNEPRYWHAGTKQGAKFSDGRFPLKSPTAVAHNSESSATKQEQRAAHEGSYPTFLTRLGKAVLSRAIDNASIGARCN